MVTIIRNAEVYAPAVMGTKDVLVLGARIGAVAAPGSLRLQGLDIEEVEAKGRICCPGFIDSHVHILGGGGEGGPSTRAPEIAVEDIIRSGVTTVIGCLGTDGVTRHMESLLAKARGLEVEGLTTYIFSGSYQIPVTTLTGSVRSDLILIDKVIGAGEIAISDHRSSQPTFEEFARLAAECRVGGMLGGKAGVLHCHLGDGKRRLEMLFRLIRETEIPATQVIPTHANRNRALLEEAIEFLNAGGYMDLTVGAEPENENDQDVSVETAVRLCLEKQAPLSHITVSSDSNGSLPVFNEKGELVGLTIATETGLLRTFRSLVGRKVLKIEDALRPFTVNAAAFYKLGAKGEVAAGKDADLLLFDKELNLIDVFALGRRMMAGRKLIAHGTFRGTEE